MLVAGNEEGAFTLSASGELRLVQSLDREAKEQYVLLITAADSGKAKSLLVKSHYLVKTLRSG